MFGDKFENLFWFKKLARRQLHIVFLVELFDDADDVVLELTGAAFSACFLTRFRVSETDAPATVKSATGLATLSTRGCVKIPLSLVTTTADSLLFGGRLASLTVCNVFMRELDSESIKLTLPLAAAVLNVSNTDCGDWLAAAAMNANSDDCSSSSEPAVAAAATVAGDDDDVDLHPVVDWCWWWRWFSSMESSLDK